MNTYKLNLLAAAIIFQSEELYKDAMNQAYELMEEDPEMADKMLKQFDFPLEPILPFNLAEVEDGPGAYTVTSLSSYIRKILPTRQDLSQLLLLSCGPEFFRADKYISIGKMLENLFNYLKAEGKPLTTVNDYISIGMAISEVGVTITDKGRLPEDYDEKLQEIYDRAKKEKEQQINQ